MKIVGRQLLLFFAVVIGGGLAVGAPSPHRAAAAAGCSDGTQSTGAKYRICMPAAWNGGLIVYAHGFVDPTKPVGLPEDQMMLPDGTTFASIANSLGYAFAASSYRKNGLAILEGLDDTNNLVTLFRQKQGNPKKVYLFGASEGGLVAALSLERFPGTYTGGVAACGPVSDFRAQVNYIGDARILFDYYFPGILPGTLIDVPPTLVQQWTSTYEGHVRAALAANPTATQQIIKIDSIAIDPASPTQSSIDGIVKLLWYNVYETSDALQQIGQAFDNHARLYFGSTNDLGLNAGVKRYTADFVSTQKLPPYMTTGILQRPLLLLHTTKDPQVPYLQSLGYYFKTLLRGSGAMTVNIPVDRFGHCNFTAGDVLWSFFVLLAKTW